MKISRSSASLDEYLFCFVLPRKEPKGYYSLPMFMARMFPFPSQKRVQLRCWGVGRKIFRVTNSKEELSGVHKPGLGGRRGGGTGHPTDLSTVVDIK